MKKLVSLALTLSLLMSLFSVAFNVSAASHYDEKDLVSGSLFNSTAVITSDGTNKSVSNDIWSFSTLAGQGSTNQNISDIAGITIDDGKTLLSKNDREGVKLYALSYDNGKITDATTTTGNAAALLNDFDGQIGAHNDFQSLHQLVTETSTGVFNSRRDYNYTVDFIVDLGSVCDISGFLVAGSNSEKFVPGMYRIYASKERATLYNNKPLIDFTDSYSTDAVAKANANAMFSLNGGNKVLARYVMFRIADVCTSATKDASVNFYHNNFRSAELAVYGTPVKTKAGVSATVTTSDTPQAPGGASCIISEAEARYVLPSKTDNTQSTSGTRPTSTKMYDGIYASGGYDDFTSGSSLPGYGHQSSTLGYTVDDAYFHEITYTLLDNAKVSNIQVVGHSNAMLTTGRYVLYAGNDKDTLYSPENIIYDYDNSTVVNENNVCAFTGDNKKLVSRQQIFNFGEGFAAKYVGMRAYDPCGFIAKSAGSFNSPGADGGAIYLRLHEFNVLGEAEYTVTDNNYTYAQYQQNISIARSLIADKEPVVKKATNYLTGVTDGSFTISNGSGSSVGVTCSTDIAEGVMLWKGAEYALDLKDSAGNAYADGATKDGKTDTLIDNGTDMYQIVGYDMGKKMTVSSLSFISHHTAALQLSKYQISFADTADDLFGENAVYTTGVIISTDSSATVTFNKEVSAQYVGFKVVCGVRAAALGTYGQSSCYARISHLDVFGTPYGSLSTVVFTDKKNNELFVADTDAEGYVSEADLEYVNSLVPEIYGYNKKLGDNGKQEWSADVYGAVLDSITVTPSYEKDTTLKYTVTHNKLEVEPVVENEVEFDQHVTLTDDAAESFMVGDSVIGGADAVSFYAAGDITVDSSTKAAPATPTVTILNTVTQKAGEKQNWLIFAHAYLPEGYTASEVGAVFVSPYTEKQLSNNGITDWDLSVLGAKYPYAKTSGSDGKEYAMLTLNGVAAESTRYVKAYVAYTDGSSAATQYAYSAKLTKVF